MFFMTGESIWQGKLVRLRAIEPEDWEAIFLVLRFFFHELGYQKVNVQVYAFNEGLLALHRRLGFK